MQTIHLSQIRTGPNPRTYFDEGAMEELVASVRQRGVIQPIVVRPLPEAETFQIIAGERRYRAANAAFSGDYLMPCVVRDVGDEEAEAIALTENVQRDAMSATEESIAAQKLVLRSSGDKDEAARSLGWTRDKLERRLALLHCSKDVREALTRREILVGHAELLATLAEERQVKVLEGVLAHNVSVHDLKAQLGQFAHRLGDAIFDTGQCVDCIHNSARQRALFGEHIEADGFCTNPAHFETLTHAALEAKAGALRDEYPTVKIVRPTDGFVRLRIVAEGVGAVGEGQAKACRACANFGCAVSALPGSLGEVLLDNCFDAGCNTVKQGAYLKGIEAKEKASTVASASKAPASASAPRSVASSAPSTSNATPRAVIEYRIAEWRKMLATDLAKDRVRAQQFLIAFASVGHGGWIDSTAFNKAKTKVLGAGSASPLRLGEALNGSGALPPETTERLATLAAAAAAFGIDISNLEVALNWARVDEAAHWRLNADFLKLITRSEIEALADEVGLKAHLGDEFKKLLAGKKEDLIAGLLAAKDFEFAGRVPKVLRYRRSKG